MDATANNCDGATSSSLRSMAAIRFSAVSFNPSRICTSVGQFFQLTLRSLNTSANRSVFADQITMTWSRALLSLKVLSEPREAQVKRQMPCVLDVLSQFRNQLGMRARETIVGTCGLVGSNKVLEIHTWEWHHVLHHGIELTLQVVLQHSGTLHAVRKVHVVDVPATYHDIIGIDLWCRSRQC